MKTAADPPTSQVLALFMRHSPIPMFVKAVTPSRSVVLYASDSLRQITGIAADEMIGKTMAELFPPELAAKMTADDWTVVSAGAELTVDETLNGRTFTTVKFPLADGDRTLLAGYTVDVTERVRAEAELRASEERSQAVQRIARIGYLDWDLVTNGVVYSREALEIYHLDSPPSLDQLMAMVHPDDRDRVREGLGAAVAGTATYEIDHRAIGGDGTDVWIHATAELFRRDDGTPVRLLGTIRDISRRKHAEEALRESNRQLEQATARANQMAVQAQAATRAKSRFLANMSHEIRTPLTAILGFAQMMQDDTQLSGIQKRRVDTISRSGEHLLSLLNEILELSKIEAGRETLERATFDVRALFDDIVTVFRDSAEARQLTLDVDGIPSLPPYVVGDERKLRQIMINLVSNAVKFTSSGGVRVRVSATPARPYEAASARLIVVVEDSGPGIEADECDALFDAFEQTPLGRHEGHGTGLGLAISRQFARMMGGDLTLTSSTAYGSTFRLDIPFVAGSYDALAAKPSALQSLRIENGQPGCRVLVVDDLEDNRVFLVRLLSAAGFDVVEAERGRQAVDLFVSQRPDVILMDQRLPDLNGDQAIRQIRSRPGGARVKIISVSASATDEVRDQTLEAGADDFLPKPFGKSELFERIRRLTGVRYLYAGASGQAGAASKLLPVLTRDKLEHIGSDLKAQIHEAARGCRHDHLLELIGQLGFGDPVVVGQLRMLVEQFDYPALIALFR
ncbi:MAG: ATP-binding protein [Acidobacteriota bacterium]